MKIKEHEVRSMTDKQFKAILEAIKIIVEKSKDLNEAKNALDKIQSVFEQPHK